MRAVLLLAAALALWQPAAAHAPPPTQHMDHIKRQILAKLGLSARPVPQRAPPRDVVRQILARAADPAPVAPAHDDTAAREIIAIAHTDFYLRICRWACCVDSYKVPFVHFSFVKYNILDTLDISRLFLKNNDAYLN